MNPRIFALGLGIGAILLTSQALRAEPAQNCADHGLLVARLAERYGETRQAIGLAGPGHMVEVFASDETGSWTILVTDLAGQSCLIAAGEAFERTEAESGTARPGDPA